MSNIRSAKRITILVACALTTLSIAFLTTVSGPGVSLAMLYLAPLLVSAAFLGSRGEVFACALITAVLREWFAPAAAPADALLRFGITLLIFTGATLLVFEMTWRKRFQEDYVSKLKEASALRREAEEDARAVVETSPAAILTVRADGTIELANEAARRLLTADSKLPPSGHIREYFPLLADLLEVEGGTPRFLRTMVEGRGHRANGEMFLAHMWLSTYFTPMASKLAVVVADVSEQVRDREELGLRQLLMHSHIVAGAVSHEVRNLAAAASGLLDNIARSCSVRECEDFVALGHLVDGMQKLCSSELPADTEQFLTGVDLNALFRELSIILQPGDSHSSVQFQWEVAENLPRVRAHRSGLLQVFLNLIENSRRAVEHIRNPSITIAAYHLYGSVMVMIADNGPGVMTPELLFQPFQPGAAASGLGLYVSRAVIRTYGGELKYTKRSFESCFQVELPTMAVAEVQAIA